LKKSLNRFKISAEKAWDNIKTYAGKASSRIKGLSANFKPGPADAGKTRLIRLAAAGCTVIIVIILVLLTRPGDEPATLGNTPEPTASPGTVIDSTEPTQAPAPTPYPTPDMSLPVIDLSKDRIEIDSSLLRINEPTPWGNELLFSAGNAPSIDDPVFTSLYLYNIDTGEETEIAQTGIKFGEIYEARFNDDWIVWLDTDQRGLNIIYQMDRSTGEVKQVKKCDYIRPRLRLYGDNLIWVEQTGPDEDRLYLYNFKSGEPVVLETYQSSTYGTSPPSIYDNIVVWAYPSPDNDGASIIKRLDLKKALTLPSGTGSQTEPGNSGNGSGTSDEQTSAGDEDWDPDRIDITVITDDDSSPAEGNGEEAGWGTPEDEQGIEPELIDPKGFAVYPATNGHVTAWLDSINPSKARLRLALEDGRILDVAESVGRIFGVGDTFVAYMQNNQIMLYFWEINRFARLTAEGEAGRLSDSCVSGNRVVWYDANDPSRTKDLVRETIVMQPDAEELGKSE